MHQALLSLGSHSHVNASRAFTMAAINVQSFFHLWWWLTKLSAGSRDEFKFYLSREKSALVPVSSYILFVSKTSKHVNTCATFIFLTMITIDIYIYIQYRQNEVLESTVSSCSLRIELTFDEKLGQAVISKRCAGTRKKEKSYETN